MANFGQMAARLVDLFGPSGTADPTKLKGNLTVAPSGNVMIGSATDDGVNKFQVTGLAKYNGNLTVNLDGSLFTSGTAATTGMFRTTGDIGGSFASWTGSRAYAVQVDSPNDANGYGGVRWTHWGSRHLAAIDAYAGGSGVTVPSIVMHIGTQTSAWTFTPTAINGSVGTVWHTGNLAHPCFGNSGNNMYFNWAGQGGQPTWLWGGSDGVNMYVYNPSNFSVNYATSAGTAGSVGGISTPAKAYGNAFTFQWDGGAANVNITVDSTFVAYVHQNVSDVRIKENIKPIAQDSLALIDQTEFVEYDYKSNGLHIHAGVVAQEVEKHAPQWVSQHDNGAGITDMRFMKHHEMLMTALHAIQQLSAEVKDLKQQLAEKNNG
jgi:hypothetical protein